jgi:hypothetical protein
MKITHDPKKDVFALNDRTTEGIPEIAELAGITEKDYQSIRWHFKELPMEKKIEAMVKRLPYYGYVLEGDDPEKVFNNNYKLCFDMALTMARRSYANNSVCYTNICRQAQGLDPYCNIHGALLYDSEDDEYTGSRIDQAQIFFPQGEEEEPFHYLKYIYAPEHGVWIYNFGIFDMKNPDLNIWKDFDSWKTRSVTVESEEALFNYLRMEILRLNPNSTDRDKAKAYKEAREVMDGLSSKFKAVQATLF